MTDHITEVQNAIRAEKIAIFDMNTWLKETPCGTAACIAGFSTLIRGTETFKDPEADAAAALGIDHDDDLIDELFTAGRSNFDLFAITHDMAIRALDDVRTGTFKSWRHYA